MEGQRLILMDGTIIENGRAGYADGRLWCWLIGYTIQQAASVFFDADKTGNIKYQYGDMTDEYDNFTNCTGLFINNDGMVSVCLARGNV